MACPQIYIASYACQRPPACRGDCPSRQHPRAGPSISALQHVVLTPGVSTADIARRSGITAQSMGAAVNQLAERGLLRREPQRACPPPAMSAPRLPMPRRSHIASKPGRPRRSPRTTRAPSTVCRTAWSRS
ncbi:MarR family transcriptional regulator [Streptomyces sp. NPDC002143]